MPRILKPYATRKSVLVLSRLFYHIIKAKNIHATGQGTRTTMHVCSVCARTYAVYEYECKCLWMYAALAQSVSIGAVATQCCAMLCCALKCFAITNIQMSG